MLIDPNLTNDRSAAALMQSYSLTAIDPVTLALLNVKLPNGTFLIPTPQTADGLVSGTAISTFREDQFNTNVDYRLNASDSLSTKFFFADSPLFSALGGSAFGTPASLPGFGTKINLNNRVLSVQEIHSFNPRAVNEARFGYNFIRRDEVPQESVNDSTIGISRITASENPGLPLILFAFDGGGGSIGTSDLTLRQTSPSLTFMDSVSLQRGQHSIRFGGEIRRSAWHVTAAVLSYGEIAFGTFSDFLAGNSEFSVIGTGFDRADLLTTDYYGPVNRAEAYAILGDKDNAFYWLEEAYKNHDVQWTSLDTGLDSINGERILDPLRSDPRFKNLLQRIGLPEIQVPVQHSAAAK